MYNNKLAARDSALVSTEGGGALHGVHTDLGQTGSLIWGRLTVELHRQKRGFLFLFLEGKTEERDSVMST